MPTVFRWIPLLWTLRVSALIVLVVGVLVYLLLAARFFRWKHLKALLRADLPRVRSVGGELAGTKATIELADAAAEERIASLAARVEALERIVDLLLEREIKRERKKKWKT
jgi:hypothetical protein